MPSFRPAPGAASLVAGLLFLSLPPASAQGETPTPPIVRLHYSFQPDCFRSTADVTRCASPMQDRRLDLGPQIAVWLEKEGSGYISDLLVTNMVAKLGIGNRPGYWKFPSTWRFPYGKRVMALPVWAHRRGKLYKQVVIQ